MSTVTTAAISDGPLTSDHQQQLALARVRARKIRRAAGVAALNCWGIGIAAALSVPFAIGSLPGLLTAVGLAIVAYNEFRGRKRLLDFDPSAATLLGRNQLGLMSMVIVYCLWMLATSISARSPLDEIGAQPELATAFGSVGPADEFDGLYKQLIAAFYATVILVSVIFQGGNALYYFTRRRHVDSYVAETPAWVLDLQRSTSPY